MYFLVLPNQLFDAKYMDKNNKVIIWECPHFFKAYNYNKKKLILHRASMQYYYDYLHKKGYNVQYYAFYQNLDTDKEYILYNPLNKQDILGLPAKCTILDSPNLLLSTALLKEYNNKTKKFFFNAFYEWSKKKLNIMPNTKSQDKYNRDKLTHVPMISQPFHNQSNNKYITEAVMYINKHFHRNYGNSDNFIFPVTHNDAKKWLKHFIENKLHNFGPYQDFIDKDDKYLYHSLLSALLNIGLLQPVDVIMEVLKVQHHVLLNSLEGFIRQLFWREYQYYCYIYFNFKGNYFSNNKKLNEDWYTGNVGIVPIDKCITEAFDTGYLHHIKRLMVIGNYMNLSGIHPEEGFRWFMEFSCDSYEWVMHQNVYEMVFFISGGGTMRRPYLSSSNYIMKMSNYSKGSWCNKWDSLYKMFIRKHRQKLWKFRYYVRL